MTTERASSPDLERRGPGLAKLLDAIRALPSLDAPSLARALAQHPVTFDDVRTFIRFSTDNYARSLVHREGDAFEVRLMGWLPGQSSALHGHGKSACALRIVRGAATEIVLGERDRTYAPGQVVAVPSEQHVHQLMNASHDAMLSLHVYAPPIPIDAPASRKGDEVVVVGGGLSGVALAYHLLKNGPRELRVSLIERGPFVGRGIAYGVESSLFLLNVPASRMSLDPSVPDDFVKYAGAEADPHAFLPRSLYGAYVNDRLAKLVCERPGRLRIYRDEAVAVKRSGAGGSVELRSGRVLEGRSVVLATGLSPRLPEKSSLDPRVVDAWDECGLGSLPRYGRVLLLGSGLSALDVTAWLEHFAFRGTVRIVSPRGLLPLPHKEPYAHAKGLSADELATMPKGLSERITWMRREVARREAAGEGFQAAFDGIRPHIETLYRTLSERDRSAFLRHVRPYWEVFRHRAPTASLDRVARWQAEGRLTRTAGRVVAEDRSGERIRVTIRERNGQLAHDEFDAIVRCIGPALKLADAATPLTASLLEEGLASVDGSGLGLATDGTGRLVEPSGESSSVVFALGAVRRASSWETTSVPDISKQAMAAAAEILGER